METKKLVSRTDYLLSGGLEELHQESKEWLDTIAFLKDETRFFEKLLAGRVVETYPDNAYSQILRQMDQVHKMLFEYLSEEIIRHEKLLSRINKREPGIADYNYREQHRKLKGKIELFLKDFREFKKMVFGYAKKW
ncbi:hypothetical protein ACT6NV_09450 [Robiginitalea sp. IMCC44478]|uniref:hypothetical protein n=1 Tax=Robiginitalea sp. IMCC44478 TaxID=3459122 RepID=UPI0040420194